MLLEEVYLHFMTPLGSLSGNETFLFPFMVWGGGGKLGVFFFVFLFDSLPYSFLLFINTLSWEDTIKNAKVF